MGGMSPVELKQLLPVLPLEFRHSGVLSCRRLFLEDTSIGAEFVVALFQPIRAGEFVQLLEVFEQMSFQRLRGSGRVVMRPSERVGYVVILQSKFVEVLRRDFQRFGRL